MQCDIGRGCLVAGGHAGRVIAALAARGVEADDMTVNGRTTVVIQRHFCTLDTGHNPSRPNAQHKPREPVHGMNPCKSGYTT